MSGTMPSWTFGEGEERALGGDADIAAERELHARAHAHPRDGRDHRHAHTLEAGEAFLEMAQMGADLRDGGARRRLVDRPQRGAGLHVEARAEGAARPLEDHRPHARRRIYRDGGLPDAVPHLDVQSVQPLGLVQGDGGDGRLDLDLHLACHVFLRNV
jgi:hypothetical protein